MTPSSKTSKSPFDQSRGNGHARHVLKVSVVAVPSLLALIAGLAGCASTGSIADPAAFDARPRRPDGVAIDPVSAPPRVSEGATGADGVLTLRTPLGVDRAVLVVQELFQKVVAEDAEGLDRLFTPDAVAMTGAASSGQTQRAVPLWAGRFRKLDYTKLAGETVFRETELQVFRGEDPIEAAPHLAIRSEPLDPNDVVIRVPILIPRSGSDRLFGDEMVLWLRRDSDRLRIYRMLEDFQLN